MQPLEEGPPLRGSMSAGHFRIEQRTKCAFLLCVLGIAVAGHPVFAAELEEPGGALVVTDREDSIDLSVPASRLSITFPRGGLVAANEGRTGAAMSSRYFHFYDEKRGLNVSGWFEPASSYIGFEKFWVGELRAMKKNGISLKEAPDVVEAGPWQAAAYNIDLPKGVSANVRAELISAGTWVDLHISVTSGGPAREAREQAVQFLKSIKVKERQ